MLRIVPVYAALLAVFFVILSLRVIRIRSAERITIGVGRHRLLERRVRAQANFAEYVPLALLLLSMAELRGAAAPVLHISCLLLVAGRVAHAWGMSQEPEIPRCRALGMAATFAALLGGVALIAVT